MDSGGTLNHGPITIGKTPSSMTYGGSKMVRWWTRWRRLVEVAAWVRQKSWHGNLILTTLAATLEPDLGPEVLDTASSYLYSDLYCFKQVCPSLKDTDGTDDNS